MTTSPPIETLQRPSETLSFGDVRLHFVRIIPGDPALTQLIKDLNGAIVKPDMAFLERVLDKDYSHYRPHGNVENRAQYLEDRKTGTVDFDSLVADDIKVRVYGDTAIDLSLHSQRKRSGWNNR